jgi:integrase
MLETVPKSIYPPRKGRYQHSQNPEVIESWKHLLTGLYWSGLRLGEAMNLHWADPQKMTVDFLGRYPARGGGSRGNSLQTTSDQHLAS